MVEVLEDGRTGQRLGGLAGVEGASPLRRSSAEPTDRYGHGDSTGTIAPRHMHHHSASRLLVDGSTRQTHCQLKAGHFHCQTGKFDFKCVYNV